jgi:hypothetical protein
VLAATALGIYLLPLVVRAVIHAIPAALLLGRHESHPDFPVRVHAVGNFLAGLADGISGYDPARRRRYRMLTSFERPFYIEGACTGLELAKYMAPWRAAMNFEKFWKQHAPYLFLLTIGSGFAGGLKAFWTDSITNRAMKSAKRVDARLEQMFFDGYAFQKIIFGYFKRPSVLAAGLRLNSMARRGFYEGVGRALWFLVPDVAGLQAAIAGLPADCIPECHVGFGIASGFAGIEIVAAGDAENDSVARLPSLDLRLGLVVGLFARYYSEPAYVEQLLAGRHGPLLAHVKRAAALFDELWQQNVEYAVWREAVKLQLAQPMAIRGYVDRTAASMV